MAGITLEYAQAQFDKWSAELNALTKTQSGTFGSDGDSRSFNDRKIREIGDEVERWDQKIKELTALAAGKNSRLGRPYGPRHGR